MIRALIITVLVTVGTLSTTAAARPWQSCDWWHGADECDARYDAEHRDVPPERRTCHDGWADRRTDCAGAST